MCVIEPHNVLVFDGLHVKLADLRLSEKVSIDADDMMQSDLQDATSQKIVNTNVSIGISNSTTMIGGTIGFMAPEIILSGKPSIASDMSGKDQICAKQKNLFVCLYHPIYVCIS
jgi:serine/threonine protein kinase